MLSGTTAEERMKDFVSYALDNLVFDYDGEDFILPIPKQLQEELLEIQDYADW